MVCAETVNLSPQTHALGHFMLELTDSFKQFDIQSHYYHNKRNLIN
jgi:hypothetical protein